MQDCSDNKKGKSARNNQHVERVYSDCIHDLERNELTEQNHEGRDGNHARSMESGVSKQYSNQSGKQQGMNFHLGPMERRRPADMLPPRVICADRYRIEKGYGG
jgi:hypothetical protein